MRKATSRTEIASIITFNIVLLAAIARPGVSVDRLSPSASAIVARRLRSAFSCWRCASLVASSTMTSVISVRVISIPQTSAAECRLCVDFLVHSLAARLQFINHGRRGGDECVIDIPDPVNRTGGIRYPEKDPCLECDLDIILCDNRNALLVELTFQNADAVRHAIEDWQNQGQAPLLTVQAPP